MQPAQQKPSRIEHYLLKHHNQTLMIIHDQRDEMKRAVTLIFLMLVSGWFGGPYGPFPIEGISPAVFWVWTIGWCISGTVARYALSFTKKHTFTKGHIHVVEHVHGNQGSAQDIPVGDQLHIKVISQCRTYGPKISSSPIRLGGSTLKIFPYQYICKRI